jgi:Growth inhibitor
VSIKRGDIYYADLSPVIGSEQGGLRPVLIVQNDIGNKYSPTVIAAAITSRLGKTKLPTHIDVYAEKVGLARDSVILLEQIRTIDKRRLKEKMGHLDDDIMTSVNDAITISFGLGDGGAYHDEPDYGDSYESPYTTSYPAAAAASTAPTAVGTSTAPALQNRNNPAGANPTDASMTKPGATGMN